MRIPEGAKCAWKGNMFSAREWEQEMFDGTVKIFEGVKRFNSVQGIMVDGDKIVLPYEIQPARSTRDYGLWGGKLEEGEQQDEAMAREFLEETGMSGEITFWKTISKSGYVARDEYIYIIKNTTVVGVPQLDTGGEKIETRSMSFDGFLEVLVAPGFRNSTFANSIIRDYILPGKQDELKNILFTNEK